MSGYKYDEEGGQFLTFALTTLLAFLVPATYRALFRREKLVLTTDVSQGWIDRRGQKLPDVARVMRQPTARNIVYAIVLLLGWVGVAFLVRGIAYANANSTHAVYDPFEILGIAADSSLREIRRRYRKLSLQFHPDKVEVSGNQTKAEIESYYIEITKAYKSLTDEETRENLLRYGHPDGRQELSLGIALPKWVVESHNNVWVLSAYGLVLGVGLPLLVARWWYGSRSRTKDGVLNATALMYFRRLKKDTSAREVLGLLADSAEMQEIAAKCPALEPLSAKVLDAYEEVYGTRDLFDDASPAQRSALTVLGAYMLRVPTTGAHTHAKYAAGPASVRLLNSLLAISSAHSRLDQSNMLLDMIPRAVQAVPLLDTPIAELLQLPHMTAAAAKRLVAEHPQTLRGVQGLWKVPDAARRAVLIDEGPMSEAQYTECVKVMGEWPRIELVDAYFTVIGEPVVTTGAIVQLVVKLRLLPLKRDGSLLQDGRRLDAKRVTGDSHVRPSSEEEASLDLNEQAGRVPSGVVHAPYFAEEVKPCWNVQMGDDKNGRIIINATKFTDIGATATRELRIGLQAPPESGLYTFILRVQSDSYLGSTASVPMKLRVEDAPEPDSDDEDDISDPEEDTIAGQMALMRGERVKRINESDSDQSSGEDDDSDDEDSDDEESGDDSDDEEDDDEKENVAGTGDGKDAERNDQENSAADA
ncbi:secretory subunit [Malassezia cuniculi]|uniref:Secretory subunit n=1 Tax=Malassezia cuniculi TaxID=948313 RepID=A0AAF0J685_9BASI|nr:secretory subunit [Malassezia cuniculi]